MFEHVQVNKFKGGGFQFGGRSKNEYGFSENWTEIQLKPVQV